MPLASGIAREFKGSSEIGLCNLKERARIFRGDHEQGPRGAGRGATALLPILERPDGYAK
jgi:hypothetical protein